MPLALLAAAALATAPARFILVGDSTMAERTGWGAAFCAGHAAPKGSACVNLAKGGRSSKSFREEGRWDEALTAVRAAGPWRATYVLIQFGHNDMPGKPGRSTDLATEFPANMARYVREARAAGAAPVLITPLTRRQFKAGVLQADLAPWAAAVREVAAAEHAPLLDLNADSAAAVGAMGPVKALELAQAPPSPELVEAARTGTTAEAPKSPPFDPNAGPKPPAFDYTHLGAKGAALFSAMVVRELAEAAPETRRALAP